MTSFTSSDVPPLLSSTPCKAIVLKARGMPWGATLVTRVGCRHEHWEERGSNDGATSEPAGTDGVVEMGWLVYNTFRRDVKQLELMVRIMTRNHRLVGKELMGELKTSLEKNVSQYEVEVMGVVVNITIGSDAILTDMTPIPRTLPCGTNKFGMLPHNLQTLTKQQLQNCRIWGEAAVPMTSWVMAHFIFTTGVNFQTGEKLVKSPIPPHSIPTVSDQHGNLVKASASGAKPGYGISQAPYKCNANAVPLLELATGQVIADGVMINYLIIPALYETTMAIDILKWEQIIGYELIPAMWQAYDGLDFCQHHQRVCPNYHPSLKSKFSPLMRRPVCAMNRVLNREMRIIQDQVGSALYKYHDNNNQQNNNAKKNKSNSKQKQQASNEPRSLTDIYRQFKNELSQPKQLINQKQDFWGGATPGPTDVSLYAISLLRFMTGVGPTRDIINDVGLLPWMYRMMDILPPSQLLAKKYFGPSLEGWEPGWLLEPSQEDPIRLLPSTPEEEEEDTNISRPSIVISLNSTDDDEDNAIALPTP